SQYDANPVIASLGLAGESEKLYKVKYHTDGTGYTPTSTTIKYYKVLKCHRVTFNANGGAYSDGTTSRTVLVPHNTAVAEPSGSNVPTKAGCYVDGWYTEAACTTQWNFSTQITGDKQLYAKWIENPKITLKVEDGAGGALTCNYTDENGTSQTCTVSNSTGQTVRIKYKTGVTFNATPTTGWKVASWTVFSGSFNSGGGTGMSASLNDVTADKTVTVKFYRSEITGTPGSSTAWRDLKRAVEDAPEGATIKIGGEIKATNDAGNNDKIRINNKITIEAKTGTATLNANELNIIFSVMGNDKELTLKNLILKKGKGTGSGSGIFLYAGKVTLQNTNIENCSATNGGAIYAYGGTLTITGGVFKENTAKTDGGAIYVKEGCNLTLNNVTIGGSTTDVNKAKNGGGICLTGIRTTGTMNGGKVSYNEAVRDDTTAQGGGIFIEKSASFTMNSGEISYNKSERTTSGTAYGGGVCVSGEGCSADNRSKFIFKKGRIERNTSGYGGGVMASEGGIFEMGGSYNDADTVIKGNSAKSSGGGVSVHGAMKMLSGTIELNTANIGNGFENGGGGIFLWWGFDGKITFDMSGGIIKNNNNSGSNSIGKGILVNSGSGTVKMRMSGSAKIHTSNNVYLSNGAKITVDDTLSNNPAAEITPKTYSTSTQVLGGSAVGTQHTKFQVTQVPGQTWSITGSGYLAGP
ncbi:InlB B-repeat-containing protein, partial [Treponema socranskii]